MKSLQELNEDLGSYMIPVSEYTYELAKKYSKIFQTGKFRIETDGSGMVKLEKNWRDNYLAIHITSKVEVVTFRLNKSTGAFYYWDKDLVTYFLNTLNNEARKERSRMVGREN